MSETRLSDPNALRLILENGIKSLGGANRFDLAHALDDLVHLAEAAHPEPIGLLRLREAIATNPDALPDGVTLYEPQERALLKLIDSLLATPSVTPAAEGLDAPALAQLFHETYERLAAGGVLADLAALSAAATPGPWKVWLNAHVIAVTDRSTISSTGLADAGSTFNADIYGGNWHADAALIAAARNHIDALIEVAVRARAMERAFGNLPHDNDGRLNVIANNRSRVDPRAALTRTLTRTDPVASVGQTGPGAV